MTKSTGYILDTPLQTWSRAGGGATRSLLTDEIEHAKMKHSLRGARPEHGRWIIVENTCGLLKSFVLQPTLDNLSRSGYTPIVLKASNKTLIIGQKK